MFPSFQKLCFLEGFYKVFIDEEKFNKTRIRDLLHFLGFYCFEKVSLEEGCIKEPQLREINWKWGSREIFQFLFLFIVG